MIRHALTGGGVALILTLSLQGCAPDIESIGKVPELSPIGSNIGTVANESSISAVEDLSSKPKGWIGGNADFFRDARASRKGDLITVDIEIDDRATLRNSSDRSRSSSADGSLGFRYDLLGVVGSDINGEADIESNSKSNGQGATARSERIELSVAAVVTRVMPNGYLLIEGSQEVAVNFEKRVLHVSGLVRPVDISPENTISYEKIAEARIAYGGAGRITEVQQPAWGQQIWDRITPF
jgi:flagellar L-ring protein precursor FlgH